jgi:hypothetical protein
MAADEQMLGPRTLRALPFSLTLALWFALSAPLQANDTMVTLGAGGLVPAQSAHVVMESESLQISIHKVTVKYVFRNTSIDDIDATMAFPLPELDGATVENSPLQLPSSDSLNFVAFQVVVDGKPVFPMVEIRAFKNGQDVTNRLQSLGLPLSVLDPGMKNAINNLSEAQRGQLEQDQLIVTEEIQRGSAQQAEQIRWPRWQMRVKYYWTQHFPSKSKVQIVHSYTPVVGGSYINWEDDGAWSVGPYCGGPAALKQIRDLKAQIPKKPEPGIALNERTISYILTTGNNWLGPIQNFNLAIESDSSDDIVLTCMPGVKRVGPTRYEVSFQNFRPDRELDLLILQANR